MPDLVEWDEETIDGFLRACKATLDYKGCKGLERRARSGTGTEAYLTRTDACRPSCCTAEGGNCGSHLPYTFKKAEGDVTGGFLDECTTDARIRELMPAIAERSQHVYKRIVTAGRKDGMQLGPTEAAKIREEILQEVVAREILKLATAKAKRGHVINSHDGGLLANPAGYRGGSLDFLENESIAALMCRGAAVQDGLMGEEMRQTILSECELIEFEGHLSEISRTMASRVSFRDDRIGWLSAASLHAERQMGLVALCEVLMALPYELNKKCNLLLQASSTVELSYFPGEGGRHTSHFDSGFTESTNTGRKVAAVYFPNDRDWKAKHGGQLHIHPPAAKAKQRSGDDPVAEGGEGLEVLPAGDRLVLLWCRTVPWEVLPTHRKRFAITIWFGGPVGPRD